MSSKFRYWIGFVAISVGIVLTMIGFGVTGSIVSKQVGEFYCYVPENATAYDINYDTGYSRGYIDLMTANNSTLTVYCAYPKEIERYRGDYVVLSLYYSSFDDESGYTRYIYSIEEQNGTHLGYYPHGIEWYGYYHFNRSWTTGGWYLLAVLGVGITILGICIKTGDKDEEI